MYCNYKSTCRKFPICGGRGLVELHCYLPVTDLIFVDIQFCHDCSVIENTNQLSLADVMDGPQYRHTSQVTTYVLHDMALQSAVLGSGLHGPDSGRTSGAQVGNATGVRLLQH